MSSLSQESFVVKDVDVTVHPKPHCKVELHVKASPSLVAKARKNAVKTIGKEVNIPGFRKGKAPQEMIEKKFPGEVEKQLHKAIADLAFVEAQKSAHVKVLNNNAPITFDMKDSSENGATLTFTFEVEPEIPSVDAARFTPKAVERPVVAEKEVEEAILQMRYFFADWTPVTDRPVQEGDFLIIDLDTVDGDTTQSVFKQVRFQVSKDRMANWMRTLVSGAKLGDVLEGMSEPDDTASDAEKKEFTPKKVRLTILKVEEAALPPVDDEFAKKVGATDVAAMQKSVLDMLSAKADQKVDQEVREQINEFFSKEYIFDLPQSLVDTEKKHRFQQMLQEPKFKKKWNQMSEEDRKKLDAELSEESAQAVRLFYLSRKIVQETKATITHKEVQDEAIATVQEGSPRRIDPSEIPKDIFALALSKVILKKAQDAILTARKS